MICKLKLFWLEFELQILLEGKMISSDIRGIQGKNKKRFENETNFKGVEIDIN